jgi:hypothetical protein
MANRTGFRCRIVPPVQDNDVGHEFLRGNFSRNRLVLHGFFEEGLKMTN